MPIHRFVCCTADRCACASTDDPELCKCATPDGTAAGDEVARCTKCGALLDVVEDPVLADRPWRPRSRFLEHEQRDELFIAGHGLPSIEVAPGAEVTSVRELEADALPFSANRIEVSEPESWSIVQLTIGRVTQLPSSHSVPATIFGPFAPGISLSIVAPGSVVELRAVNTSSEPRRLAARLLGAEIIPRTDPAHPAMLRFLGK